MSTARTTAQSSCSERSTKAFQRLSTRSVPVADRFDYWRSLFKASRIERPHVRHGVDFNGEIINGASAGGVVFSGLQGEAIACHFGAGDSDMFLLGCVRAGMVAIRRGSHQITVVQPRTGLVLFDCDRPFNTVSGDYAMDFLVLPRKLVINVMADEPVAGRNAVRILRSGVLARSLQRHMHIMATQGERLDAAVATDTIATARGLAVAMLAGVGRQWRSLPGSYEDDVFAAAHHALRLHADDAGFTAAHLAAVLGCSRAHLYRLFERKGQTVTGQLRELRLRRAWTLLGNEPHQSVGMIAMRCGYTDLSAFGKAFRRQFDVTPSDCRQLLSAGVIEGH